MKTISTVLQTAIDNGTIVTCVKVTSQVTGEVQGFTSHDVTLSIGGVDYDPTPGLSRIVMNLRNNTEVSNQEFAAAWVVDLPESELSSGVWDNAEVEIFKADWTGSPTSDTVPVFQGHIGLIQWTEDGFRADIHSNLRDLGRVIGVQVTGKCRHELFSTSDDQHVGYCGLSAGSYTYSESVNTVDTQRIKFTSTATGQATGYCRNGVITFTSGDNNGISREVKTHTSLGGGEDQFEVFVPFPFDIAASDTFDVVAGCDKTFATCKSKFSNGERFGGFPHIKSEINFK